MTILDRKHHRTIEKNIFKIGREDSKQIPFYIKIVCPTKNTHILDWEEKHEYFDFLLTFTKKNTPSTLHLLIDSFIN